MAIEYKVRYRNYCTPQEQILEDGRWYLDSDAGRTLSGTAETSATLSATGTLATGLSVTTSPQSIASSVDFIYVKNTGSNDVVMSLTTDSVAEYRILLSAGETFASEISTSANVRVMTTSGETSTIEYFSET